MVFDLFVIYLVGEFNVFYLFKFGVVGDFEEMFVRYGLSEVSYVLIGFGVVFIDFEFDGDKDIVLVNGWVNW